jgi:hypothetical protein
MGIAESLKQCYRLQKAGPCLSKTGEMAVEFTGGYNNDFQYEQPASLSHSGPAGCSDNFKGRSRLLFKYG